MRIGSATMRPGYGLVLVTVVRNGVLCAREKSNSKSRSRSVMVVRRVLINESFRIRNVVTRCWRLDNKHTVLCSAPEWEAGVMPYCIAHSSRLDSSDRVHLCVAHLYLAYAVLTARSL